MNPPAILFDIDGTLLYARGLGRSAFGRAFETVYGLPYPDLEELSFVGATDSNVVRNMAAKCGVPNTPAREEHFFLCLAQILDAGLAQTPPMIYPGVLELLNELNHLGYRLGVITGNIRATAWSKLRHAGLDHAFCFGAYGNDHHERDVIAQIACQRAPEGCRPYLLIGDTPSDIAAARTNHLKSVAVATGWVTAKDLHTAGADLVVDDFANTENILAQLAALR